ncbi:hypothetical protein EIP86_006725 [Pleurotus ostreatoroseus]|nr:hypothetical protein EIP86_006725 [Pleurotus ostreatoroseus]
MARKKTGGRRGNKGNFHGQRLAFLEQHLPQYYAAATRKHYTPFWDKLFADYWAAFPWHLPNNVEPNEENMICTEPETPERELERAEVRLKSWFRYRWLLATREKHNPWDVLLKALRESDAIPPRRIPGWKIYMRTNNKAVLEAYDEQYPGRTAQQRARDLKIRCDVARGLWDKLSDEERKNYDDQATKEYEEDIAVFKEKRALVTSTAIPTAQRQIAAHENVTAAVSPLLELIAKYTGTCVALFLGAPPSKGEKNFFLKGMTCGTATTTKLTWSEHDRESFHAAMRLFGTFVVKTDPMSKLNDEDVAGDKELDAMDIDNDDSDDDDSDDDSMSSSESSDEEDEEEDEEDEEEEEDVPLAAALKKKGKGSRQTKTKPKPKPKPKSKSKPQAKPKPKPKARAKPAPQKQKSTTTKRPRAKPVPEAPAFTIDDPSIGDELRAELANMSERERAKELRALAASTEWEVGRENNLARNRALWKRLEDGAGTGIFDVPVPDETTPPREGSSTPPAMPSPSSPIDSPPATTAAQPTAAAAPRTTTAAAGVVPPEANATSAATTSPSAAAAQSTTTAASSAVGVASPEDTAATSTSTAATTPSVPTAATSAAATTPSAPTPATSTGTASPSAVGAAASATTFPSPLPPAPSPSPPAPSPRPTTPPSGRTAPDSGSPSSHGRSPSSTMSLHEQSTPPTSPVKSKGVTPAPFNEEEGCNSPTSPTQPDLAPVIPFSLLTPPATQRPPTARPESTTNTRCKPTSRSARNTNAPNPRQSSRKSSDKQTAGEGRNAKRDGRAQAPSPSSVEAYRDEWPSWVQDAYDKFKDADLGDEFKSIVESWIRLEKAYRWESLRQGLQTNDRPEQIGYWMQHLRRDLRKLPQIEDLDEYAQGWWAWWRGMQPDWRLADDGSELARDGTGGWDKLRRPGKNGMLLVLLSLWWWKSHPSVADRAWLAAVDDVQWVLTALLSRAAQKRASDDEEESRPSAKRARK